MLLRLLSHFAMDPFEHTPNFPPFNISSVRPPLIGSWTNQLHPGSDDSLTGSPGILHYHRPQPVSWTPSFRNAIDSKPGNSDKHPLAGQVTPLGTVPPLNRFLCFFQLTSSMMLILWTCASFFTVIRPTLPPQKKTEKKRCNRKPNFRKNLAKTGREPIWEETLHCAEL